MLRPLLIVGSLLIGGEALAVSGETEDTTGAHRANSTCGTLQDSSGTAGDLYFVCNADRTFTADGREPCDVYSLSTLVRGPAIGFCGSSFGAQDVQTFSPDAQVLEQNKQLRRTFFGANTGLRRSPGNVPHDVLCVTFAGSGSGAGATQGDRVCVEIYKAGASTVPAQCSSTGGATIPVSNSATACNAIEQELRRTITGGSQLPVFSHALFSKILSGSGGPNSQALFVCQGYSARCANESGASAIDYWASFWNIETPGMIYINGRWYKV